MSSEQRRRISIAIHALGGQGGGVLADWILAVAQRRSWIAQGTSVPGVAQRTGATVYYIELFPGDSAASPVLALMPVPGDVDVVIAAELMEAGQAMIRGFVSLDRTTLIASLHRVYAIAEKMEMGDGRADSDRIIDLAIQRARRFVAFDMDAAALASGSVISAVMLGALAGSSALPFSRGDFEEAIRDSGLSVGVNLKGFEAGFSGAVQGFSRPARPGHEPPLATSPHGKLLERRIDSELPAGAQPLARHGVKRLMDYQDAAYAGLYLDRLQRITVLDAGDGNHVLTAECARYLALWMSYEDTIRVADLKTRASRLDRVRSEVAADAGQIVHVTEFMHPRLQEICDTLPAALGQYILDHRWMSAPLTRLFGRGRYVKTSRVRWFTVLSLLAGLRRWRRGTLRFRHEQARIETWLDLVAEAARSDQTCAREIVECQRLIKGYGDTFERGLKNYEAIVAAWRTIRNQPDAADRIRRLRAAALADDKGETLTARLQQLAPSG
jgi:indolepyruvate ferredoxin oxidoreductase beta subunit